MAAGSHRRERREFLMKITFRIPNQSDFLSEQDWKPFGNPFTVKNFWITVLKILPIFIIIPFSIDLYFSLTYGRGFTDTLDWSLGVIVLYMLVILVLHELVHASFFPGGLFSQKSYVGISFPHLVAFAYYDGVVTRNRYLLVLLAPFTILTVIPLLLISVFGPSLSWFSKPLIQFAYLNGLASVYDLYSTFKILKTFKRNVYLRSTGKQLFWKEKNQTSPSI